MKKIKILFILPKTQQGGAETQLLYLLRGLDKGRFEVHLGLLYSDEQMKHEYAELDNVRTTLFRKRSKLDLGVFGRIAGYIRQNGIDIVQAFMGHHHAFIPVYLTGCIGIGSIRSSTKHSDLGWLARLNVWINGRIVRRSRSLMIANSHAGLELYRKMGYPEERLLVIPNGINYGRFSKGKGEELRKELGLGKKIILTYVARMDPKKNHLELVGMMSGPDFANVHLLLAGDGPSRKDVESRIAREGLGDRVTVLGLRKDIPDLLAATDIFVYPSRFPEGWPNALGEAMAAGVPCVAYDIGDISRIIQNGIDGFVTSTDIGEFRQKVVELCRDRKLRSSFASKAKKKIRQGYSIEMMVSNYEKVYDTLMQASK